MPPAKRAHSPTSQPPCCVPHVRQRVASHRRARRRGTILAPSGAVRSGVRAEKERTPPVASCGGAHAVRGELRRSARRSWRAAEERTPVVASCGGAHAGRGELRWSARRSWRAAVERTPFVASCLRAPSAPLTHAGARQRGPDRCQCFREPPAHNNGKARRTAVAHGRVRWSRRPPPELAAHPPLARSHVAGRGSRGSRQCGGWDRRLCGGWPS